MAPSCLLNKVWDWFPIILYNQASPYPSNLNFHWFPKNTPFEPDRFPSLLTPYATAFRLCSFIWEISLPKPLQILLCFPSKCICPSGVLLIQPPPKPLLTLHPSLIPPDSESAHLLRLLCVYNSSRAFGEISKQKIK